jgi:hypothetical protein
MRKIAVLAIFVAVTGIFVWIESAVHSVALAPASFSERWAAWTRRPVQAPSGQDPTLCGLMLRDNLRSSVGISTASWP